MRVTFNELATRELNDAAQYYEHEQAGLGTSFINEVERCAGEVAAYRKRGPRSVAPSGGACASGFLTGSFIRSSGVRFEYSP